MRSIQTSTLSNNPNGESPAQQVTLAIKIHNRTWITHKARKGSLLIASLGFKTDIKEDRYQKK